MIPYGSKKRTGSAAFQRGRMVKYFIDCEPVQTGLGEALGGLNDFMIRWILVATFDSGGIRQQGV